MFQEVAGVDELERIELLKASEGRYWSHVDRTGECWLWTAGRSKGGYGVFHAQKMSFNAHRVGYLLQFGVWPGAADVCHRCDTPACQRGDHLFLGDAAVNAQDMSAKGRWRNQSRLTPNDVRQIRALCLSGLMSQSAIAKQFGIHQPAVSDIMTGRRWSRVS